MFIQLMFVMIIEIVSLSIQYCAVIIYLCNNQLGIQYILLFGGQMQINNQVADINIAYKITKFIFKGDITDTTCSICLDDYKTDDKLAKLNCTHIYHESCVTYWLQIKSNCPTCRNNVEQIEVVVE